MKPDALALFQAIAAGMHPRDAGARLGIHPNRVYSLCEKWADRGWLDCGVSLTLGWLTPEGKAKALELNSSR